MLRQISDRGGEARVQSVCVDPQTVVEGLCLGFTFVSLKGPLGVKTLKTGDDREESDSRRKYVSSLQQKRTDSFDTPTRTYPDSHVCRLIGDTVNSIKSLLRL